jgi:hypothetical protein
MAEGKYVSPANLELKDRYSLDGDFPTLRVARDIREKELRGGSACLDSFCQFISGAWRMADYAAVCRVVRLSS